MGTIPPGSTLVFDTKLMEIQGIPAESVDADTNIHPSPVSSSSKSTKVATNVDLEKVEPAVVGLGSEAGPKTKQAEAGSGECRLLGPFALVVQSALGILALLSLVFKRWRERPRRPIKVWLFDVPKQVCGTALLHVINIAISTLSSTAVDAASVVAQAAETVIDAQGNVPNPCSYYLLNLAIDVRSPTIHFCPKLTLFRQQ